MKEFFICRPNLAEVFAKLQRMASRFERVAFLKWQIEYMGVDKGLAFHGSTCVDVPAVWIGILSARAGDHYTLFEGKPEQKYFLEGVETWKVYCQLQEWLFQVEHEQEISLSEPVIAKALTEDQKPSYRTYVLMHYYWSRFAKDCTKEITKTNAGSLAKKYDLPSADYFLKVWLKLRSRNFEPTPGNRIAIKEHVAALEMAIPLLKTRCLRAAEVAELDVIAFKKSNPEYFKNSAPR